MIIKKERLNGVDSKLVLIVEEMASCVSFDVIVVEGLRSLERQKELVAKGASRTMKSKHLIGKAVDLAPYKDGKILWEDKDKFKEIARVMDVSAKFFGINLIHGYDWSDNGVPDEDEITAYVKQFGRKPLVDYPHHELVQ